MYIYILLIILIFLLYFIIKPNKSQKKKKNFIVSCFFLIIIISAFRGISVSKDTSQYCRAFSNIASQSLELSFENYRFEIGFIIFCKILGMISNEPQILIIVTSIIIFGAVGKFIYNNSENSLLSILIFIFLNYFFMYMSAMRQALAIAIILYGYDTFLKNNKKFKFVISVLFASLFHVTSLVVLIFLVLPKFSYKNVAFIFTMLLAIIAYVIPDKIFSLLTMYSKYSGYANLSFYEGSDYAGLLNFIMYFCLLVFSYCYSKSLIVKDKNINSFLYILSINLFFYSLACKISIFSRVTTYFNIFNIIYITNIIANIKNKDTKKIILFVFPILICLYWFIIMIYRPEWYGAVPYVSFLNNN